MSKKVEPQVLFIKICSQLKYFAEPYFALLDPIKSDLLYRI